MEYQKIINLLSNISNNQLSKFITRKYIEVFDQSDGTYNVSQDIRFKAPQLRSDLCDWEDAYNVVTGKITVTNPSNDAYDKKLALKNNAPFFSCVLRINEELIDDCQGLDIVMPLYNLLYYSKKYHKTTGSLWNYYRDEPNTVAQGNINYSIRDSKSFDYKTSLTGKSEGNNNELENIKTAVPLKYLSKCFRSLVIPLINCEIFLDLKWSKNCVLTSQTTREADPNADPSVVGINNPPNAEFGITDCKLYVPVVTLSTEYKNKLYRILKEGFTVDIYWERYRCQLTNQRAGLINYLIDSNSENASRLFVLAYENEEDRLSFSKYYTPSVEITDYNVLIDQQAFCKLPVKI